MKLKKRSSILVVDDQAGIRAALESLLDREFTVYSAGNAWEAVLASWRLDLDVALIDLSMPKLANSDALRWIRKSGAALLLTSVSGLPQGGMDQLAGLGIYGFISKPWDNEVLRCLVRAAAAQRRWERCRGLFAEIQEVPAAWVWTGS